MDNDGLWYDDTAQNYSSGWIHRFYNVLSYLWRVFRPKRVGIKDSGRVGTSILRGQFYVLDAIFTGEYLNTGDKALIISGRIYENIVFRVGLVVAGL